MERMNRYKQKILSGVVVGLGMALSACQSTEAGTVMAIEEEGDPSRHIVKKIIGGVVMTVKHLHGSRRASLVISEARVSRDGRPDCRALTGRVLTIGNVQNVFKERPGYLRSAMVVTGESGRLGLSSLAVGDCVSVAPDDMDRSQPMLSSSIEIEPSTFVAEKKDHFGKGIVELWGSAIKGRPSLWANLKKAPAKLHRIVSRTKPTSSMTVSHMPHPA